VRSFPAMKLDTRGGTLLFTISPSKDAQTMGTIMLKEVELFASALIILFRHVEDAIVSDSHIHDLHVEDKIIKPKPSSCMLHAFT
jgi:hypothetical protein